MSTRHRNAARPACWCWSVDHWLNACPCTCSDCSYWPLQQQQLVNRHYSTGHNSTPSETECLEMLRSHLRHHPHPHLQAQKAAAAARKPLLHRLSPWTPELLRSVPREGLTAVCTDAGINLNIILYLCRITQVIMKLWLLGFFYMWAEKQMLRWSIWRALDFSSWVNHCPFGGVRLLSIG